MRAVRLSRFEQTGLVRTRWAAVVLSVGLLTGCAQDPVQSTSRETVPATATAVRTDTPSAEPSGPPSPRQNEPATTVIAAQSDFGMILFDATGQAIYIFDIETTTKPLCYDDCAAAWPPVLTYAAPRAGQRVNEALLGTTPRADGTTQVTYGGHPLYLYAHEGKGEVKCHDVFLNGGNWYAVQPDGKQAP
jgi:predicted lipoprotein with Yx(FWY)xxD motif